MEIKYNVNGDQVDVVLEGELDTPATVEIQAEIDKILEYAEKKIVIDCSKLSYIASSGLRQFISIYKKCSSEGGHLTLKNVVPDVMEIFAVTNFDRVFDII